MAKPSIKVRKKVKRQVSVGVAHICATFNNTKITITDAQGNAIAWSSGGVKGFKGSRKSTPFAATEVVTDACEKAKEQGLKRVSIKVKAVGSGRESAVRAVQTAGLEITSIEDVTPIPHNGCRPPKKRRI